MISNKLFSIEVYFIAFYVTVASLISFDKTTKSYCFTCKNRHDSHFCILLTKRIHCGLSYETHRSILSSGSTFLMESITWKIIRRQKYKIQGFLKACNEWICCQSEMSVFEKVSDNFSTFKNLAQPLFTKAKYKIDDNINMHSYSLLYEKYLGFK